MHVIQTAGIGQLLAHLVGFFFGIGRKPAMFGQVFHFVAETVIRIAAATRGEFPLRFGRQTVVVPGLATG